MFLSPKTPSRGRTISKSLRRLRFESLESRVVLSANFAIDTAAAFDLRTDFGEEALVANQPQTINVGLNSARDIAIDGNTTSTLFSADAIPSILSSLNVEQTAIPTAVSNRFDSDDVFGFQNDGNITETIQVESVLGFERGSIASVIVHSPGGSQSVGQTDLSFSLASDGLLGRSTTAVSSSATSTLDLNLDSLDGNLSQGFAGGGRSDGATYSTSGPEFGVFPEQLANNNPQAALSEIIEDPATAAGPETTSSDSQSASDTSVVSNGTSTGETAPSTINLALNHTNLTQPQPIAPNAGQVIAASGSISGSDARHELAMARQQRFSLASDRLKTRGDQGTASIGDTSLYSTPSANDHSGDSSKSGVHLADATDVAMAESFDGRTADNVRMRSNNNDRLRWDTRSSVSDKAAQMDESADRSDSNHQLAMEVVAAGSFLGAFVVWQRLPIAKRKQVD